MSTIRAVMTTEIIAVYPHTSTRVALEALIDNKISGVPVVTEDDRIVGVLSEMDLLKVFYEDGADTVERLMTRDPRSFHVDDALVDVVDCLMANNFRRVLIHEDGKLVGLISRADLLPAILEALIQRGKST